MINMNQNNRYNQPYYNNQQMPPRTNNQRPAPKKRGQFSLNFNMISLILTTIALNVIWWVYPLVYSRKLEGTIPTSVGIFFVYTLCIAVSIFMIFSGRYKSVFSLIPITLGVLLSFNGLTSNGKIEIFLLLLLFSIALIVIQVPRLNLRNGFGLTIYSFMASTAIPLAVFYFQNNYLTQRFLFNLIPLLLSFLFFMTPIFYSGQLEKRFSLIFGIIYSLNILTLGLNIWTAIAIALVAFTWFILINMNLRQRFRLATFTILQMLSVLIIFMQQVNQ